MMPILRVKRSEPPLHVPEWGACDPTQKSWLRHSRKYTHMDASRVETALFAYCHQQFSISIKITSFICA
ncbi:unnamed protein product [Brugia pahangi]|uniref:Transposase n=1 Tax=Brugia pahangi TaxID=6280 RepID=A0A0N4TKN8_BRUPA|nr:unnamed protein product [Brugia pahangi]